MLKKFSTALATTILGVAAFVFSPNAGAAVQHHSDCGRVAAKDRAVCKEVSAQRAYGWTDDAGTPQNWEAKGTVLVHEITHQGYSKPEMSDALRAEHANFRAYVSAVTFNVDAITKACGHHMGAGEVQEIRGVDGHRYTWAHVVCD